MECMNMTVGNLILCEKKWNWRRSGEKKWERSAKVIKWRRCIQAEVAVGCVFMHHHGIIMRSFHPQINVCNCRNSKMCVGGFFYLVQQKNPSWENMQFVLCSHGAFFTIIKNGELYAHTCSLITQMSTKQTIEENGNTTYVLFSSCTLHKKY